ncbi:tetratricopeptide repeat domain-containing protein [Trichoderma breve]|uniref:Tetratricopeptide repeat domain-containing protein n=1 Tax=Trichoderma breve TaxID=2034170 RepID=A0A9W9BCX0_9HYPO|nr:tetratricopeptide repeat domain-containing protein [Trichoderma breve]KAJ4857261.1 tetratricopeptide repeat domain-containing protein [Trichoderma breve]
MYEPGLHTIYGDSETSGGLQSLEPEIDVVAVHGLNFKGNANHARATWNSQGSVWIRDFLPQKIGRPCRVMLFAYNSSPAKAAAAMRLDEHARMLLSCLKDKRKDSPLRPIVFLCHSLGGIVVKSALVEGTLDPAYGSIVKATRLLVFFATPHLGGNYSGIGDIAAKIVRTGLGTPSNDLLDGLKAGSRDVIRRFEQARHLPANCLVISFYETENYGRIGLIVEKESAVLNLSDDRERKVALKANHSKICKFPTAESCESVMEMIVSDLERALELQRAMEPGPAVNVHWTVKQRPSALFTGRDEIVQTIVDAIDPRVNDSKTLDKMFVITGMGGQGKSEVCLNVASQLRNQFWGVFWVDVATAATAARGFAMIAHALRTESTDVDDVRYLLANWPADEPWLLILDNADDSSINYADYIPSGERGTVLMTSRLPECAVYKTLGHIELGNLSKENCIELLLNSMSVPEPLRTESAAPAEAIVEEMGFHTLAILQAGAYISSMDISMEKYLIDYREQADKLLKFVPSQAQSRYRNVWTTFEISVQALKSSNKQSAHDALQLLEVLSTLHYDDIPLDFFQDAWRGARKAQSIPEDDEKLGNLSQWHVARLPAWIDAQRDKWDEVRLDQALNELVSLALIKRSTAGSDATVSLHPLIHSWVAIRQDETHRRSSIQSSACIIALTQFSQTKWHSHFERLGPHIMTLTAAPSLAINKQTSTKILQVLLQISISLRDMRYDAEVSALLEQMLRYFDATLENPRSDLLPIFYVISRNQLNLGEIDQCIQTIQKVRKVQQSSLHEHGTNRLGMDLELARAYDFNGQWKEAIAILENIRQVHELHMSLNEDDPDRLTVLHLLGEAYESSGRTKEAIALLTEVVSIEEISSEKGDPTLFSSKYKLATCYLSNCQIDEAIAIFKELDEVQAMNFSDRHPYRLGPQIGLAKAHIENGKSREAIEILENVKNMQNRLLESGHSSRPLIENHLGAAYRQNGEPQKAIKCLKTALKLSKYRQNHPHHIAIHCELAAAYRANGQITDAVELLEKLGALEDSSLSNEHPIMIKVQAELASLYVLDSQWERAMTLLQNTIELQENSDKSHPNLSALQQKLGTAYLDNGEVRKAVQILEELHELGRAYLADSQVKAAITTLDKVVKDKERLFHKEHPERLASLHELASAYLSDGQIDEAARVFENATKTAEETLREDHPTRIALRYQLACVYLQNDQVDNSILILEEIANPQDISDAARVLPSRVAALHQLGLAYTKSGRVAESVAVLEEAVEIRSSLDEGHPNRLASQYELGSCYLSLRRLDDAVALLEEVVRVETLTQGRSISLAMTLSKLGSAYLMQGKAKEAVEALTSACVIRRSRLEPNDVSRLTSEHDLGLAYLETGNEKKGISTLEELLAVERQCLEQNHPLRMKTQYELACAYMDAGKLENGIQLLENVVSIKKWHPEEDTYPTMNEVRSELAKAYKERSFLYRLLGVFGLNVCLDRK